MKKILLAAMLIAITGCSTTKSEPEFQLYFDHTELEDMARKSISNGDYKEEWNM